MLKLPLSDDTVKFEKGGVLIGKQINQATIVFYTNRERILVETPIDYYLIESPDLPELIYNSWNYAAAVCPEKVFSQPDRQISEEISTRVRNLFNVAPR